MIEAKPETLIGDRAYDSDPLDDELRKDGIEMVAPHRSNLDGHDWARRTDAELVKAVCHFMTHDGADYADLTDALATDDEFALLNPDPIYQEGWFHGVCQHSIPRYVVQSRFEQKEGMHPCVICGKPFKAERSVKTCSPECSNERRRRYINGYANARYHRNTPRPRIRSGRRHRVRRACNHAQQRKEVPYV
jgi:hypothetical protein